MSILQYLPVIIGGSILLLLGFVHLVLTLQSSPAGGPMTPTDPTTRQAMERIGGLGLAPDIETSLWRSWVGFNLSHSVGVIVIALVVIVPAATDLEGAVANPWWLAAALGLPPVFLLLSIRYWFKNPTVGITLAGALIWGGVAAALLA